MNNHSHSSHCLLLAAFALAAPAATPFAERVDFHAYPMLTRDGRRLVGWSENGKPKQALVATNDLPANLPPVREWKIYNVRSTHTDIGLHNSQYIQRHGAVQRLDLARKLVADDPDDRDPAAMRYVVEGYWFFHNYPLDKGEAATRELVANEMKRGRIGTSALCAGNHTEVYGFEELCRSMYTRRVYEDRWGLSPKTFFMADNPGVSWSMVQPCVEAGIENFLFMPNQWNPLPSTIWPHTPGRPHPYWDPDSGGGGARVDVRYDSPLPMVFWWEAADGVSRLLTVTVPQYASGGIAFNFPPWGKTVADVEKKMPKLLDKLTKRYPYDIWINAQYGDDEPPKAVTAELFKKWNAKWRWPELHTVGNPDEPFQLLKDKWGDRIPVLRGTITSGWLQHAASTPELLACKFAADRALAAAEAKAAVATATEGKPYPAEELKRAWWALILNDEHSYGTSGYKGRRVFETWLQHRDWIETAEHSAWGDGQGGGRAIAGESQGGGRAGARPSREGIPPGTTSENRYYRVTVAADGTISSIYDKELNRELLEAPANRFLYTRDAHATWEADPAKALGAELIQTVRLDPNEKRIWVESDFRHAVDLFNDSRYFRYGYLAFPFAVPGGKFLAQLNGPVMRPYEDLTGHSTDAYVGVREWVGVENGDFGVALIQFDSCLAEFGEIHPDKTCYTGKPPAGKSAIYSYLFADWLQMHNPDGDSFNPRFRYAITSYKGTWQQNHVPAMAERTVNPELAAIADKYIHADQPNLVLAGLKAAEDGSGYIARFRETEGRQTEFSVIQSLLPDTAPERVTIIERPFNTNNQTIPNSNNRFTAYPYQFVTIKIPLTAKTGGSRSVATASWTGRKEAVATERDPPKVAAIPYAQPDDSTYRYTELVTHPHATHGEKDGQLYLEWGLSPSPDFHHYELWRAACPDGVPADSAYTKIAEVAPEIVNGLAYRVNRYEDTGLATHTRYAYRIRPVFKNGRQGDYSEPFYGTTRRQLETGRTLSYSRTEGWRLGVRPVGAQLETFLSGASRGEVFYMQQNPPAAGEVHGGVPICWPWFGRQSDPKLPKHGFARYAKWTNLTKGDSGPIIYELRSSPETRKLWPHDFRLLLKATAIDRHTAKVEFTEENTGKTQFESTWGFHPYFKVANASNTLLNGEKLPDNGMMLFQQPNGKSWLLDDPQGRRQLEITCSDNEEWLVWNPGVARTPLCETLGPEEWRNFICVEPCTRKPKPLPPGTKRTHVLTVKVKRFAQ